MLHDIKARFPQVNVHGFSPPELHHFTKLNKLPLREVLQRLKRAGLGSIPGGGAEILVDRVRGELTRGKVMTDDWLNVMRVWHELGGRSTATMMFGHVETLAERIEHLERVRQLQDETGGFTAFICWTFQPKAKKEAPAPERTREVKREEKKFDTDEEDVYVADQIVAQRKVKNKILYKVRWKGYEEKDDTWEPARNLPGKYLRLDGLRSPQRRVSHAGFGHSSAQSQPRAGASRRARIDDRLLRRVGTSHE
jgi:2-iminoacetate synthase ThiH